MDPCRVASAVYCLSATPRCVGFASAQPTSCPTSFISSWPSAQQICALLNAAEGGLQKHIVRGGADFDVELTSDHGPSGACDIPDREVSLRE